MEKTSDFYNFPVGDTKIRIMSEPIKVTQRWINNTYEFCDPQVEGAMSKYWCWAIVRDGGLKILKLPYSVVKKIQSLLIDPDYQFDGYPMPYDLTVRATGEGKERGYEVSAARKNSEVMPEEQEEFETKTPILDIVNKMKEKAGVKPTKIVSTIDYPDEEFNPPF